MTSFVDLPQELRDNIFTDLDLEDLFSLSLTSKALYSCIRPTLSSYLYENISLTWQGREPGQSPKIDALLRTLTDYPELATRVRVLRFETYPWPRDNDRLQIVTEEWNSTLLAKLESSSSTALQALAREMPTREESPLTLHSPTGYDLVVRAIAALILRSRNLTTLSLDLCLLRGEHWPSILQRSLNSCAQLRELSITAPGPGVPGQGLPFTNSICQIIHLVDSTRLETLKLYALGDFTSWPVMPEADPSSDPTNRELDLRQIRQEVRQIQVGPAPVGLPWTHLTTLRLLDSVADPSAVCRLLKATPRLGHLQYHYIKPISRGPMNLDELHQGLLLIRETLTQLEICHYIWPDDDSSLNSSDSLLIGGLGPLSAFPALTDLIISFPLLYGHIRVQDAQPLATFMPPSLRCLTINDDLGEYGKFVDWETLDLVMPIYRRFFACDVTGQAECHEAAPELDHIILNVEYAARCEDEKRCVDMVQELASLCSKASLKCEISYRP